MHDYAGFTNTPYVEIKEGVFDSDRNDDGVIQKDELVYSAVGENGILAKYAGYNVQDLKTPIAPELFELRSSKDSVETLHRSNDYE